MARLKLDISEESYLQLEDCRLRTSTHRLAGGGDARARHRALSLATGTAGATRRRHGAEGRCVQLIVQS